MFKGIVARVLLFGVPFSAAYVFNRPVPTAVTKVPVVCVYPGDRPGELRVRRVVEGCSERDNVSPAGDFARPIPAMQSFREERRSGDSPITIPF